MTVRGIARNYIQLALVAFSTVGVTEIIKNFIQRGGKRLWTLVTIVVGVLMVLSAFYLPEKVLYGIVGVSGATVFYDTIFKTFSKLFETLGNKIDGSNVSEKKKEEEIEGR